MEKNHYRARKKSVYSSFIKAILISLFLCFLIIGFIVGSFSYNISFYLILFIGIFLMADMTLAPISGYEFYVDENEILIWSFKKIRTKRYEWDKVRAVSLGMVYNKYSRYNNSYYGIELHFDNEIKNLRATYEMIHLEDHEGLMNKISNICSSKNIECIDLRN